MTAVDVQHGSRVVRVSTSTFSPARPVNVVVLESGKSMGGLSMSRENAERLRDALEDALEETKPKPSKADRIRQVLRDSRVHGSITARDIENILREDGPL